MKNSFSFFGEHWTLSSEHTIEENKKKKILWDSSQQWMKTNQPDQDGWRKDAYVKILKSIQCRCRPRRLFVLRFVPFGLSSFVRL